MAAVHRRHSPESLGYAFTEKYYQLLESMPEVAALFYKDESKLGRPEVDDSMSVTTTMNDISLKLCSLKNDMAKFEIESVISQRLMNDGVQILVGGTITGEAARRKFVQTFFLAPQPTGYFVLNDMLRYLDSDSEMSPSVAEPVSAPPVESQPAADEDVEDEATDPPVESQPAADEDVEDEATEELPKKSDVSTGSEPIEIDGRYYPPLAAAYILRSRDLAIASPDATLLGFAPGSYGTGGIGGRENYGGSNNMGGSDAFNVRSEYVNRGGNQGGGPSSSNRDDVNSSGGRMNRDGKIV